MIKLIISDYDSVLIDLKELHFEALNKALFFFDKKYIISEEEHIKIFDGLSTKDKLKILNNIKGLPLNNFDEINDLKQKFTIELLEQFNKINTNIPNVISSLKGEGYMFYVASNAVRKTIILGLEKLNSYNLIDKIYSNQDVRKPKPSPEIYLKCMIDAGVSPDETLIIEDSKHGKEAAVKSGAHVCAIDNSFDFTLENIKSSIKSITYKATKWSDKLKLNVLIPMAGMGSRFVEAGYKLPKPLIDVDCKPMIRRVVENLNIDANYIFIAQRDHYEKYNLKTYLELMVPDCKIILTDGLTEGAACTALLAKDLINNDQRLLIANSDQLVDWDSCDFMYNMISSGCDGGLLTFKANETKWSYAKLGFNGFVEKVAEKKVISDNASVGIYYYKHGKDFVKYAEQMISKNIRVKNEFYICPVYNEYIADGKKLKIYECNKMNGLGTPEDLLNYLNNK